MSGNLKSWLPKRFNQVSAFIARCLICFFEAGSLKSYGVLVEDLTKQTQMSFAMAGLILPLQHSLSYILAPVGTALANRFGYRTITVIGGFLAGLGYISNGIFPLSPIVLIIFCACIGCGYGIVYAPSFVFLKVNIPEDATFGIVQILTDQFIYIGICILPVLFDKFQDIYGTQGALLLFGGLNLHIVVAGVLMRPLSPSDENENRGNKDDQKNYTDSHGIIGAYEKDDELQPLGSSTLIQHGTPDGESATNELHGQSDFNPEDQLCGFYAYISVFNRNKSALFLTIIAFFHAFNISGWVLFLVPIGKEKGLLSSQAVLLSSVAGVGALFGRVLCIILFWKEVHNPFYYFGLSAIVQCLSFTCLALVGNNYTKLVIASFITGVPFGVFSAAIGSMCALKVSSSDFSRTVELVFVSVAVGTEIGGGVSGAVYDYSWSGVPVFLVIAASDLFLVFLSFVWWLWEENTTD
ncbi:Monocarboxylate transporter 3 [Holothuria leucospilota]|uniref:Monocarboxylate transporter 3 n=1 Tax=Holothuria leucospilota TaxID=206669 RepID=A0A9Q1BHN6_HOLLE|nr:Monocarboxylate transporter 3 [Holothuria leucospilota]